MARWLQSKRGTERQHSAAALSAGMKRVREAGFCGLAALTAIGCPALPRALAQDAAHAHLFQVPARGIVRPVSEATISADLQARVARVAVKEGDAFKAGDVLIEFDCRRLRAELAAAKAQRREMELALDNNLLLNEHRAIGKHEVEVSRARVDKATGEFESLQARLDDCLVSAPFDGRVAALSIHAHETPQPGKSLIALIDDRRLEIELIVPSDWLRWLRADATFDFVVDELKRAVPARVTRINAAVDPVSQTVKVVGEFAPGADMAGLLAGMSGAAQFPPGKG